MVSDDLEGALEFYDEALDAAESRIPQLDALPAQLHRVVSELYWYVLINECLFLLGTHLRAFCSNKAAIFMRTLNWEQALASADAAIALNSLYVKAHWRRLSCLIRLRDWARYDRELRRLPAGAEADDNVARLRRAAEALRWGEYAYDYYKRAGVMPSMTRRLAILFAVHRAAHRFVHEALAEDLFPAADMEALFGVQLEDARAEVFDGTKSAAEEFRAIPNGKLAYYAWSALDRVAATIGDKDALVLEYSAAFLEGRLPQYFEERLTAHRAKAGSETPPAVSEMLRRGVALLAWSPLLNTLSVAY